MCFLSRAMVQGSLVVFSPPFFIAAVIITWNAKNTVRACILYSKNDPKLAGRWYRARGKKVLLLDSEYADDTAIIFNNQDLTNGVNRKVTQFVQFRMEVHKGIIAPRGEFEFPKQYLCLHKVLRQFLFLFKIELKI